MPASLKFKANLSYEAVHESGTAKQEKLWAKEGPFCPVILGLKLRNYLTDKEIKKISSHYAD